MRISFKPSFGLILLGLLAVTTNASNQKFVELLSKMEADVLELGREVERLYAGRCTDIDLAGCFEGNFDHCRSSFPNPECSASIDRRIPACGDQDGTCSGIFDFTASSVRLPTEVANGRDGNPTDKKVIESLCLTRTLDDWFVSKRDQDAAFWAEYEAEPRGMYYGSSDGAMRIFPARQSPSCGTYDPRVRPWYVAGGSGPKNILLVLDVSGSMDGRRLQFLKTAAKRVITTLGIHDRIAIVPFSGSAHVIGRRGGTLLRGSEENKEMLVEEIDRLQASGATNFQAAFRAVFDLLDRSYAAEHQVNCNTAILFLTDGVMTSPDPEEVPESTVMDEIVNGVAEREEKSGKPIILFTYSVSEDSQVHRFPQQLSCSVENGIWTKIRRENEIVDSLSNYYGLFSLELSRSESFTTWVEPYTFSTGSIQGTTVSTPVYDRTLDPPVFLGVAGMDFTIQALDRALGNEIGSQATIDEFNARPAICPNLELSKCMLESFRRQGLGGNSALCHGTNQNTSCNSSEFAQFEPISCGLEADYPSSLWANVDYRYLDYEERTCCVVGEEVMGPVDEGQCKQSSSAKLSGGAIAGIVIGSVVIFCLFCIGIGKWCSSSESTPHETSANGSNSTPKLAAQNGDSRVKTLTEVEDIAALDVIKPPPRNPSAPFEVEQ